VGLFESLTHFLHFAHLVNKLPSYSYCTLITLSIYLQIPNLISFWMYEVSPSVLESRLLAHHSVVDAAVVGIPDKDLPSHQTMPYNIQQTLSSKLDI
jgi:hypothetical protein